MTTIQYTSCFCLSTASQMYNVIYLLKEIHTLIKASIALQNRMFIQNSGEIRKSQFKSYFVVSLYKGELKGLLELQLSD